MSLRPTNVPLTVKDFDEVRCGVCVGCGCSCGYILYLRGGEIADLYGHPHDPNGIGSLCSKGLALIQEARDNPLRMSKALRKEGEDFREIGLEEVFKEIRDLKGKTAIFLDRITDLKDYATARKFTDYVYSDSIYLPFRASTLRPQEWREQKVIVALECDPVFSEVMATRWLVDAFERSAYILSVSSRYATTSAKATERLLVKPPLVVRFLQELADFLEGKEKEYLFKNKVEKIAKAISLVKESLLLIGETLLRSPWRGNVPEALRRIRRKVRVNYSIVGNVSPFEVKELGDFLEDVHSFDNLILTGNPALYLSEEELRILEKKNSFTLTPFPNLTANHSRFVIPSALFTEREFINFKNGFGFIAYSPQTIGKREESIALNELIERSLGVKGEFEKLLSEVDVDIRNLRESEGGVDIDLPPIEEWEGKFEIVPVEYEGVYLLCDNYLVDEVGHWNVWTHELEREQFAYMNRKTARKMGVGDELDIRGVKLRVKISENIADDVIYIPSSFEETQPFNPGVRPGRLLENPSHRIEAIR